MSEAARGEERWLTRGAGEPYAYLTTIGRRTGHPHRIEIWFATQDGRMFLLAGGRDRADWVRNLVAGPRVTVELGGETHAGAACVLHAGSMDDALARALLVAKYRDGDNLDEWGSSALAVVIEFATNDVPSSDPRPSLG